MKYAARDLRDAQAVIAIRNSVHVQQRIMELDEFVPYAWQRDIIAMCETVGDDRKINVIWDPEGGKGKTLLSKWLMYTNPNKYYVVNVMSNMYHMATIVSNALASGWSGDTLILNLSRSNADHKIYDALECIRDGMITSQKGMNSGTVLWCMRHMIIMCNWMPKLSAMSKDRWVVWSIVDGNKGGLVEVPYDKAMGIWRDEFHGRNQEFSLSLEGDIRPTNWALDSV